MSDKPKRFRYEAAQVLIGKIAILAASMISSIYFSRVLQAEGKGAISIVTSIEGIFVQFCNFGLHSAHTYYVSKDKSQQNKAAGNVIICFIISVTIGMICYPFLILNPDLLKISSYLVAMALLSFVFNLFLMLQENLFLAIGNINKYNILQVLSPLVRVIVVAIISVWLNVDVYLVATMSVVSQVLIIAYSFGDKTAVKPKMSFRYFKEIMPYGIKSYVACLATYLLLRTDVLMLNYYLPKSEVGLYSLAVSLSDMLYMFSSSVSAVLFPKLSAFENTEQKYEMVCKVIKVMTPVIILTAAGLGVLARVIVLILYGEGYLGSVPLVRALLVSAVAWGMSGFVFNFFAAENKFMEPIVIPLIGFIINVIMNFFLIQSIHTMGAAIASDVSYTFVCIAMFYCMFQYVRKEKNKSVSRNENDI